MAINSAIFKAYDIRGVYPTELNEDLAYRIGQAYAKIIQPKGVVAVGMDVRLSSPQLKQAVIKGLVDAGIDVLDVGLISTEMIYFATGFYQTAGGIQVTASHNPSEYNGFKMVRENVVPISSDNGIFQIRDLIINDEDKVSADKKGKVTEKEILDDFTSYIKNDFLNYWKPEDIKPMKVVVNPNFGFEGEVIKAIVKKHNLPITIIGLNDIPDGTFPKGRPDPFVPENRPEFVQKVVDEKADLGVAWDADADRVFFCTSKGKFVEPYYMNALFIDYLLKGSNGNTIIYDPRYTWALIDSAKNNGAKAVMERVGHSFIKARMRRENAIFSGESSGHTYFRDFFYADGGALPLLIVLQVLSATGKSLDQLLQPFWDNYFISGEINSTVENGKEILAKIKERYHDAEINELDGLSIEYPDWRANMRTSNTEPLMRLNVEAKSKELAESKARELLGIIRG